MDDSIKIGSTHLTIWWDHHNYHLFPTPLSGCLIEAHCLDIAHAWEEDRPDTHTERFGCERWTFSIGRCHLFFFWQVIFQWCCKLSPDQNGIDILKLLSSSSAMHSVFLNSAQCFYAKPQGCITLWLLQPRKLPWNPKTVGLNGCLPFHEARLVVPCRFVGG